MWHLRAGLIWITGAYSFSFDCKPCRGALSKISQKYIIDTRHRKVPSSSPTPWGRSASAGGKKGSWGGRRTEWRTKVASFSLFVIWTYSCLMSLFLPTLLTLWMDVPKSGPGTPPSLPPSFRQAFSTFYILAGLVTMLFDSNNRMWGS